MTSFPQDIIVCRKTLASPAGVFSFTDFSSVNGLP